MDSIGMAFSEKEGSRNLFVDNIMKYLTVAEWKTLLALAYHGSRTKYDIKQDYSVTYTTVDRVIRSFEKAHWVTMLGRTTSSKGTSVKNYALTQEGLLWLLSKVPSGYIYSFDSETEEIERALRAGKEALDYVSFSHGIVPELKVAKRRDDVYKHIYKLDNYVPRIAKNNQPLFPTVFGGWNKLKADAQAYFPWVICRVAKEAVIQFLHERGGLMDKFGTLDRVLAYLMYKSYLQEAMRASGHFGSQFHKQIWEGIRDSLNENPDLRQICVMICEELEAEMSGSLSLVKQLHQEFGCAVPS
jgi:DNA-binding PadR family transcriptional regulator